MNRTFHSYMPTLHHVMHYVLKHQDTYRDKDDNWWLSIFMQEVGELAGSLNGRHEHPPELELAQLAAICINWLDKRDGANNDEYVE